ncbi:MAG TPA: ribonuclease H-like domain-containing protein [Candidatus Woesebacteria bacterium]|nr:ribonuclease H-like domain-containing protein [Candidatus Woesebacteria bacterium]
MISQLSANQKINEEHFLVKKVDKKTARNGNNYYDLELNDSTGVIIGRIWDNALPACNFEIGKVIEVSGQTDEYNGKLSLIINACQIVNGEDIANFKTVIPTMVFDLETVGDKFEELDQQQQDYLFNTLEKYEEDKEKSKKRTALYAIFGKICAAGCYNPDKKQGITIVIGEKKLCPEKNNFTYIVVKNEKELLEKFWELASKVQRFVTFNGNNFDIPYLIIRSGINRVKIPFEIKKYSQNFIDLEDRLKQNGKPFKLEMLCRVFGIDDPKDKGVTGAEVSNLFYQKKFQQIADYVTRDAVATAELYQIWREYLSGEI